MLDPHPRKNTQQKGCCHHRNDPLQANSCPFFFLGLLLRWLVRLSHGFLLSFGLLGDAGLAGLGLIVEDEAILAFFGGVFGGEEKHVIFLPTDLFLQSCVHFGKLCVREFSFGDSLAPDPADLQFHFFYGFGTTHIFDLHACNGVLWSATAEEAEGGPHVDHILGVGPDLHITSATL